MSEVMATNGPVANGPKRGKRIAVFCDGTWNVLAAKEPTNVVFGAQMVLPYDDANSKQQLVFYKQGVGTSYLVDQKLEAWLGGAFGWGLFENIEEAYRFLVFNYRTGDEIYLFGFSRGAFTARSLAGLIRKCGIVHPDRLGMLDEAFKLYKTPGDIGHPDAELAQRFRADNAPQMIMKEKDREWRRAHGYKELYEGQPFFNIKYLGVWDTVGALGVPRHLLVEQLFHTAKKYQFHDLILSSTIAAGRHAVALDENRLSYKPTLWENLATLNEERPDSYEEKWFPGDHSSVGGGGDVRGLSHAALLWIMEGAKKAGLDLDEPLMDNIATKVDVTAPLRASSAEPGFWSFVYQKGDRTGPNAKSFLSDVALERINYAPPPAGLETKSQPWQKYRPGAIRPLLHELFPDER